MVGVKEWLGSRMVEVKGWVMGCGGVKGVWW